MSSSVKVINNGEDLKQAWAIRKEVFVVEQNCPENIEWEYEDESVHYLAELNNFPVGTARWRKTSKGIKFERFAVLPQARKSNFGSTLLKKMLEHTLPLKQKIYLHAQLTAVDFYLKHGFKTEGGVFMEADIAHVTMVYDVN